MYAFLRKVPLFADLSDDDLHRICRLADEVKLEPGKVLFAEGDVGDKAYVIREGEIEVVKASSGREVLLAVRREGDVIGEMSLVEEAPRMATARARGEALLVAIGHAAFEELVQTSVSAARALLHTVIARLRGTEVQLRQSEKMAQLGTMTAGMAHELNNPAAAVQRGAEQLRGAQAALVAAARRFEAAGPTDGERAVVEELLGSVKAWAGKPGDLDPLARSDREGELEAALDALGVPDPWEVAAALVAGGIDPARLAAVAPSFEAEKLGAALCFVARAHAAEALAAEIHQGAARIAELVKALKRHVYLDQAPVQSVDVHQGLDDTLVLLRGKLKDGIRVVREYSKEPPQIQGWGSELNQVWTNLLDNAADALGGKGTVTIRTSCTPEFVVVEIEDDGPGIPAEIQGRVFDPFFTTKPIGKGTGLGLDISWGIVVNRHRGEIGVESRPGRTVFRVRLPRNFEARTSLPGTSRRPPDDRLREILETAKTVAVVGASPRAGTPANDVPRYLLDRGYRVLPVNPRHAEVLGKPTVPSLEALPETPDIVLVFRRGEETPQVVADAVARGAKVIWMTEGVLHEGAAAAGRAAGAEVVMDTCIRTTHRRLIGPP
jgi:signal transduction histidine kinase/predicted CoA-binding protein